MKRQKIISIYEEFHSPSYLTSDPLVVVHRYKESNTLPEIALLAAVLSYGRVAMIIKAIEKVLALSNDLSSEFLAGLTEEKALSLFADFKYRFHTGNDIALLCLVFKDIRQEHGTLTNLSKTVWNNSENGQDFFQKFTVEIKKRALKYSFHTASFDWLFPSPSGNSPCKRMAMYLRWMVRNDDGIDLGIWPFIPTSALVIPVDTHVARVSKELGLTSRKSSNWKMALEITENLQKLDKTDPVKFDFSLCRAGMFE